MKPTYRKSWARNLLMLDLTLDPSFKVKQWFTGFGELSFRWIQICIGSPMCRSIFIYKTDKVTLTLKQKLHILIFIKYHTQVFIYSFANCFTLKKVYSLSLDIPKLRKSLFLTGYIECNCEFHISCCRHATGWVSPVCVCWILSTFQCPQLLRVMH